MSSENNSVEKVYTYEITNKNGKTVTKRVVRKYTNKKDTTNTLQNKANKEILEQNIRENFETIKALPERKRISHIRDNYLPENVTASYNTIRTIWQKVLSEGDIKMSTPKEEVVHEGTVEEEA